MSDDPLAQFRRSPSARPAGDSHPASGERETYRAFAGKDNQRRARLDIRCKDGLAHAVGYQFLVEIVYDRRAYTGLILIMTTMLIKVSGRNLRPLVESLKLGACEFIQEWNAEEFDPPEDVAAPFVQSIVVESAEQQRREREEQRQRDKA